MSARAVIFDLDGTLLDTLEDLARATNHALGELGHPPHPVAAYRHLVGDGVRRLLERALPPPARSETQVTEAAGRMLERYRRTWRDHTLPYPGVDRMLDGLAVRNVPAAIFSNKPHDVTVETVATILPRWSFAVVRGARTDTPHKPDPTGALEIATALGLDPGEVLFCGDTNTDMWTATRAGMHPVGALWGFRDAEELQAAGARDLLEEPEDLLDLLERLG